MHNKLIYTILMLLIANNAYSFTGLGDSKDKTALIMKDSGAISVNITDNSVKAGYLHLDTAKPFRYGFEISGKAADGISKLFDGQDISPETGVKLSIGYQPKKHHNEKEAIDGASGEFIIDQWYTFSIGYRRGEYTILDSNATFDSQISKRTQDSPNAALYANYLVKGISLVGVSIEYARENNFEDLKEVKIQEETTLGSSGTTTRVIQTSKTARKGDFSKFDQLKQNIDILYVPGWFNHQLGIDLFSRYSYDNRNKSLFSPGIGIFVLKEKSPSKLVAGITAMKNDANNKLEIGFVAGYHF